MTCIFPDCDRQPKARGLCPGHYQQQNRGEQLRPLRRVTPDPKPPHRCDHQPSADCYTHHACRCADCCSDHTKYHKHWRLRTATLGPEVVDSTGTVRRLRALCRAGWSRAQLAALLGIQKPNVQALVAGRERVTRRTRDAVRAIYDTHWQGPPDPTTGTDRARLTRARRTAERHGWAAPMDWDDNLGPHGIDNPAATPYRCADPATRRRGETAAEVRQLLGTDSAESITTRLGYASVDVLATTIARRDKALADRLRAAQIRRVA